MSVLTTVHTRFTPTRRRTADSPLDSTSPVPQPAANERAVCLHAHWRTVTGPDGRRRLEAVWRPTH
ncbi:hypothetical protein [Streptomyces luteireticuli]|uniref:hypothetical protein n=1 Tax=Streptomyces luteireticuli TaxID=173858 RepID=UPI003557FE07